MKVLLVCSIGMSTSLLTNSMRRVAGADETIEASSYDELEGAAERFDVVLLGPQIRFRLSEAVAKLAPLGKPVAVIDMRAYGIMDGVAVMAQARELFASA